jgi:hypothetical protein
MRRRPKRTGAETHLIAYSVKLNDGDNPIWTRIGAAWATKRGSGFSIQLVVGAARKKPGRPRMERGRPPGGIVARSLAISQSLPWLAVVWAGAVVLKAHFGGRPKMRATFNPVNASEFDIV